ncbi:helix-turn-helix transcriptional regulator [Heyndrickxia ginsengihumi]|uniref:helix-turn-helix transcriptional regulator n=1 Tax=Heyndrickxia ginsengihumi TaxID=363870 RepID=UPI0030ED0A48
MYIIEGIFHSGSTYTKEFADKIGVSSSTLTFIKKGRQYPSFSVTYRIGEKLDMDVREIWIKE